MKVRKGMGIGSWILLLGLFFSGQALAHTRSQSFSSWYIQKGKVRLTFTVRSLEATRLGLLENSPLGLKELLVQHLRSHVAVSAGGQSCRSRMGPRALAAREGYLRVEWSFVCPDSGLVEIANEAFFAIAPSHVHYARIRVGKSPPTEYLFTHEQHRHVVTRLGSEGALPRGTSLGAYLLLGVEHIFLGLDHLAFLLALLLFCRRLREAALMVTGFTLGHSLTLSLAILGVVRPNVAAIEALIGFTIALVAAENVGVKAGIQKGVARVASALLMVLLALKTLLPLALPALTLLGLALFTFCYLPLGHTRERAVRLRPLLTILFGFIHGFGFASVLMEIGLPAGRLLPALLGFNLGVEIGQMGVVAGLWALGLFLGRYFARAGQGLAVEAASAALLALGLFWFVGRAVGA